MSQYLFIDGAYLRSNFEHQMRTFYGQVPRLNFKQLCADLEASRIYYYDAIDYVQATNESEAAFTQRVNDLVDLHDYINSIPGVHVRDGRVRRSPVRKKREQKGVDVQLAVDALEHAARGNVTVASVLTGDLDFEPLLECLVRLGIRTKLVYVPSTTPKELLAAADDSQKLTLEHFFGWSEPSFRTANKVVQIKYNEHAPDAQIFKPHQRGRWKGRDVTIFSPVNQSAPRLYVAQGDEVRDSSLLMVHMDIVRLAEAFELTFGKVEWESGDSSAAL